MVIFYIGMSNFDMIRILRDGQDASQTMEMQCRVLNFQICILTMYSCLKGIPTVYLAWLPLIWQSFTCKNVSFLASIPVVNLLWFFNKKLFKRFTLGLSEIDLNKERRILKVFHKLAGYRARCSLWRHCFRYFYVYLYKISFQKDFLH